MTITSTGHRACTRTPINWNAIYLRSVRPRLTPADVAWLDAFDRPTPRRNSMTIAGLLGNLRALLRLGGAR